MKSKKQPKVKMTQTSAHHAKTLRDLKEAVEEMNLIKNGQLKARNARDLFDEL